MPLSDSAKTLRIAAFTVATATLAQTALAQSSGNGDSTIVRNDPVVIVDGARVSQDAMTKLQNTTAQIEILRGSKTTAFGPDAEGGVLQITTGSGGAQAAIAGLPYGMPRPGMPGGIPGSMPGSMPGGGGGNPMNGGGNPLGTGGGAGNPMSNGGNGGSPMNGFPGRNQMDPRAGVGGGSSPAPVASSGPAIYPIVVINGARITDNDLFKVKAKMSAKIEVLDSAAATAKYGQDAAAGAIVLTPVKEKESSKAKSTTKSSGKSAAKKSATDND